ncbi:HPP family protein [Thermodesulfobacteriota bacterium]
MYEFTYYRVRDVMTANPITITGDIRLAEFEAIFEQHDFNGLPVVDAGGRLKGMLTKLDLLKAFVFTDKTVIPHYNEIMGKPAATLITSSLHVFTPETSLTRVLQKMLDTRFKSFPVTEGDRLVGIIAREDIIKALRLAAEGRLPNREK